MSTTEDDVGGSEAPRADTIDDTFVPRIRENVVSMEIDGETVLVEGDLLTVQHLDRIGTIVFKFFDGSASLRELADDFADAFNADVDQVREDIVDLARNLGRYGLLDGIAADPVPTAAKPQAGVPVGSRLPDFRQPDLHGRMVSLGELAPQRVLLVNWSPACGFCVKIAPDLAEHESNLAAKGIALVLLSQGSVEANRELVEQHGILSTVLVRDDIGDDDPFPGQGTPVAYLLDEEGAVASPLAVGALAVPELIHTLLGGGTPA